jgi:hypothetical protein
MLVHCTKTTDYWAYNSPSASNIILQIGINISSSNLFPNPINYI